jgi:hypothetical protein
MDKINMKHKKILAVSVVLVLAAFAIAIDITSIGPGDAEASANSTDVSVPINLKNNQSVSILEFELNYPEFLIFRDVTNTSRIADEDAVLESNVLPGNTLKVSAFVPGNISAGEGAILNLIFDVNESALPGNYSLNISEIMLLNDNGTVEYNATNSVFRVI